MSLAKCRNCLGADAADTCCAQGLCALFAPGNRHAVVGTKEGTLQILDIGASAVLDTLEAHQGPVRACFGSPAAAACSPWLHAQGRDCTTEWKRLLKGTGWGWLCL
jgi:hypothetical protein